MCWPRAPLSEFPHRAPNLGNCARRPHLGKLRVAPPPWEIARRAPNLGNFGSGGKSQPRGKKACGCISQKVYLEPKWLRCTFMQNATHKKLTNAIAKKIHDRLKADRGFPPSRNAFNRSTHIPSQSLAFLTGGPPRQSDWNKEEQIIETQDKPQCLVAAKATLTLTVPGCNRVVYRGFIASAI